MFVEMGVLQANAMIVACKIMRAEQLSECGMGTIIVQSRRNAHVWIAHCIRFCWCIVANEHVQVPNAK